MRNLKIRHLLKSSASMWGNSGSQFLRETIEIQSGPDTFDESRFLMTPLTILGVIEILCSLRLVLEGKTGNEIRVIEIRVLRKVFSKTFCFIRCRRHRGGITDLPLLRTLLAIFQIPENQVSGKCNTLLEHPGLAASIIFL